jgi:hypothetical protein
MIRGLALVAAVVVATLAGCARVQPWQRELHARREMRQSDPTERRLDGHVAEYREGSVGGTGVGTAGCGCN